MTAATSVMVTYVHLDEGEYVVLRFAPALHVPIPAGLTAAERDVAARMLAGASNAQIATARGTSSCTVAKQVASVFRKLGVESRADLARLCAAEGIQAPD